MALGLNIPTVGCLIESRTKVPRLKCIVLEERRRSHVWRLDGKNENLTFYTDTVHFAKKKNFKKFRGTFTHDERELSGMERDHTFGSI